MVTKIQTAVDAREDALTREDALKLVKEPAKEPTVFEHLREINVSHRIEKKMGLSYLSWAFAVDELLKADAAANWEYPSPTIHGGETMMVYCAVTAFGKTMTAHLPVMDHRNKPIPTPDAFQINTAYQRCLVKAIALHGIGLYIYAGEDLPDSKPENQTPAERSQATKDVNAYSKRVLNALDMDMEQAALDIMREAKEYDESFATDVWRTFTTPVKNRIRELSNRMGQ
jgi:hypothetical protein